MKHLNNMQKEVSTELAWKELIEAIKPREILVHVNNGIVTLSGSVESFAKKKLAEKVVSEVSGVLAIQNSIEVKPDSKEKQDDNLLTDKILDAFIKNESEMSMAFSMNVENDWLTLMGEVENEKGEMVLVKGRVCKLEQTTEKKLHHPALITNNEIAYWEVFG